MKTKEKTGNRNQKKRLSRKSVLKSYFSFHDCDFEMLVAYQKSQDYLLVNCLHNSHSMISI